MKNYKIIRYIESEAFGKYTLKEAKIEKKKEKKLHPENLYRIKRTE